MTRYAHASNKLLGIQIDAAINPGSAAHVHLSKRSLLCCSSALAGTPYLDVGYV